MSCKPVEVVFRGYDAGVGALAKLDKAPVSKTGDSRFESWVPRSRGGFGRAYFAGPGKDRS